VFGNKIFSFLCSDLLTIVCLSFCSISFGYCLSLYLKAFDYPFVIFIHVDTLLKITYVVMLVLYMNNLFSSLFRYSLDV